MKNPVIGNAVRRTFALLVLAGAVVFGLLVAIPGNAQTVVFDFDTATPALAAGQNIPLDQSTGGLVAHFSATSGAFSVQNHFSAPLLLLSEFSGNYLYPNVAGSVMLIQFSLDITNLVVTFATAEQTPIEPPTAIRLTAYTNSTSTPPVGSSVIAGKYFGANTLPMGTNTFSSATPFNLVTLNIEPGGAIGLLIDNLTVQVSGGTRYTIQTSASPEAGGTTKGSGTYLAGATVGVEASPSPGYEFVNWTENGVEVSNQPSYQFIADSSRTLVANFLPTWNITTQASPATDGSTTGDGIYLDGATVNAVAIPNPGYAFVNWTDNGVPVSTWESYLFTASSNRALVANFAPACTITAGSSTANTGWANGGGIYVVGSAVTLVAMPKTGYAFVNWTENGYSVSTSAAYVFTASKNQTLVANFASSASSVTFDFDTATPVLTNAQTTPFDQTSGGLTAHFSSTNDPAFSVQSSDFIPWQLSRFSSNFLAPNVLMSVLDIQFSRPITDISVTFATLDFQDILTPSPVQLTAYTNSSASPPVGTATAQGTYIPADTMPMGVVSFHSTVPFDLVTIAMPPTPSGATDFIVDNIAVQTTIAAPPPTLQSSDSAVGPFSDDGTATVDGGRKTITVPAKPGNQFYRLRSSTSTRIVQIQATASQVILGYE